MTPKAETIKNTAKLLDPWQPHKGMEVLIARFDQAQIYAFFVRNLMDDKKLITYFLSVIKKTGKYARSYEDWLTKDEADKTYANLNEYWHQDHLKMKCANPTAQQYEYGMNANATETNNTNGDIATIMEQLANAIMLTGQRKQQEHMKTFEAHVVANITTIQQQMNNATMQQQQVTNNNMQQFMAQQQAFNRAKVTNPTMNVPTGNWQPPTWHSMSTPTEHVCPPVYNMNTNQSNNKNQQMPFRCYKNNNYCWAHGHHIEDDHTSSTCTMPTPSHQPVATKHNTMRGVNWGIHKTIMPSQSGCTRCMDKQHPPSQEYQMWKVAGFPPGGAKQFRDQLKAQGNQKKTNSNETSNTNANGICNANAVLECFQHPNEHDAHGKLATSRSELQQGMVTIRGGRQL